MSRRLYSDDVCHCKQCDAVDDEPTECPSCHGDGCGEDQEGVERECPTCHGTGLVDA